MGNGISRSAAPSRPLSHVIQCPHTPQHHQMIQPIGGRAPVSQRRRPPQRTPTPEATPAEAIPPIASTTSLERRVAAMLAMYQPFAGEPVVVAVSGGADSLSLLGALLALCAQSHPQAPGEIVVATFEHGLRGAAGQADARWVADFAAEQGVRCVVGQGDTHALARREHRSLEDAARRLRYAFLREVAAEVGAQY